MKRLTALFICIVMVFSTCITAVAANPFTDVDPENYSWAVEHIDYFVESGVVDGISPTEFSPNTNVTREQFAKLLILTFKLKEVKPATADFSDVKPEKWSYGYIEAVKDYMTHETKIDGSKWFRPEEFATREEIASAVVKMLGLTSEDVLDLDYAKNKFKDFDKVSAEFREDVNIAAEYGIIEGMTENTFEPDKGITRAAAVVMLSRAAKFSTQSIYNKLSFTVKEDESSTASTRVLIITGPENATFKVDGKTYKLQSLNNTLGQYKLTHTFTGEGKAVYEVTATLDGVKTEFKIVLVRQVDKPVLIVDEYEKVVYEPEYTFTGIAEDSYDYNVKIYMNGEYIDFKTFSKKVTLAKGDNTFVFYAQNSAGKKSDEVIVKIYYEAGLPVVRLDEIPATTTNEKVTISGTVTDPDNLKVTVIINNETISEGTVFSKEYTLKAGDNTFEIYAINSNGRKSPVKTVKINYNIVVPIIELDNLKTESDSEYFVISGRIKNGLDCDIFINDANVGRGASFSKSVKLVRGENIVTIRAVSRANGKSSETLTHVVYFEPAKPIVTLEPIQATTKVGGVMLVGYVSDINDPDVNIFINGVHIGVGNFEKYYELTLGGNAFTVIAINKYGIKSDPVVAKIIYAPDVPIIYLDSSIPTITYSDTIDIKGYLIDFDIDCKLYINDSKVSFLMDGSFSRKVKLTLGENLITVKAVNKAGAESVKQITVTYAKYA